MNRKTIFPRFNRNLYAAGLILIFFLMSGCTDQPPAGNRPKDQKEITDAMGRQVMVPSKINRVVDLAMLDGTRTLLELGVSDKIAGVNDDVKHFMYGERGQNFSCWFAPPKVAPQLKDRLSVGSCREPNVELIKSLEPDIILASGSFSVLAGPLQEQTGVPVVCIKSSGCLDLEMIRLAGELMGRQARARTLIDYTREKVEQITRISSKIPETKRVRVFFWGWPVQESPKTIAPYDPIDLAGGVNVAMQARIKPYEIFDITKEQLAVWNPDMILLQWWTPKKIGVRIETILSDPALQTVFAVKNKQVFYSRSFMRGWDPAMGLCEVVYMAKLFYPEWYPDLDVEKEGNDILKQFYGKDGLYTDFVSKSELHRWTQAADH